LYFRFGSKMLHALPLDHEEDVPLRKQPWLAL
jgi:hypothetical protein